MIRQSVRYTVNSKPPITSYGIILFYYNKNKNLIYYLIAQRRNTIEYTDILRGYYSHINLRPYCKLMTQEEKDNIQRRTFDELWDDLWINHDCKYYKEAKERAKNKFLKNYDTIVRLIDDASKQGETVLEPSWGFPKGKKNQKEGELHCAIREFKEETKLELDYINVTNIAPSVEIFKGSNGKTYKTIYYIAEVDSMLPFTKISIDNELRQETISEEISNLKWCTLYGAMTLLHRWRKRLLLTTQLKVKKYLNNKLI